MQGNYNQHPKGYQMATRWLPEEYQMDRITSCATCDHCNSRCPCYCTFRELILNPFAVPRFDHKTFLFFQGYWILQHTNEEIAREQKKEKDVVRLPRFPKNRFLTSVPYRNRYSLDPTTVQLFRVYHPNISRSVKANSLSHFCSLAAKHF